MVRRTILISISMIIAIFVLAYLVYSLNRALQQDDWKKRTTPLPKETRDLLCANFGLPQENLPCSGDKDVYALDFFTIIRDAFHPYEAYGIESSEAATYDEVDEKIGSFEYECEPVETTGDGFTYFSCSYDLRGDREFVMTFLFSYPEKAVMRIMSTSRFDD